MKRTAAIGAGAALAILFAGSIARADYDNHAELKPSLRCGAALLKPGKTLSDNVGDYTQDCQPLVWDLPATTHVGPPETLSEYDASTGFLHGKTDRPPPLYVDSPDTGKGYETGGGSRVLLCSNPLEVPWWEQVGVDQNGKGRFQVACRRGIRVHYGPWQVGTDPNNYDRLAKGVVRFDNTAYLDADGVSGADRWEWNVASEFYNHFGSHHATCWNPANATCNNPDDPATASQTGPGQTCEEYQKGPTYCPTDDLKQSCEQYSRYNQQFRNATQYPGRLYVDMPTGRAVKTLEDQLWGCDHHVVSELPLGYQGNTVFRNFRNQTGGLTATANTQFVPEGQVIGGTVGEMIIQLFSAPNSDTSYKPLGVAFDVVVNAATTFVPPFTLGTSGGVWYAPYDLAIGILAIHSHKRMVKGTVDVVPLNPVRAGGLSDQEKGAGVREKECGVSTNGLPPDHIYSDWHWDDAPVCKYYLQPDGPLILHKGDALVTRCTVNNGIIQPSLAPEPLGSTIVGSAVGQELLYGEQNPMVYRVRYGCEQIPGVPPGYPVTPAKVCRPNPGTDPLGNPMDGPYANPEQCTGTGLTGICGPANIVFANVAEDEMCIGVALYWPLDEQQLPGTLPKSPSDLGYCPGCSSNQSLIPTGGFGE